MFAPNWSGFIEYNYMDFDTDNLRFAVAPPVLGITAVNANVDDKLHVIKAGLNWRFNWGGGWRP